jgi:aspartyl-tRNA(Asn)/glutamyl-tRNA(Gln) amidotransferase subunit A
VKFGALEEGKNLLEDYALTRGKLFGKEVRRRIMLGTYVLSAGYYDAYYGQALKVRSLITDALANVFKDVDVLVTPTTPSPAFKIGEKTSDPLQMYLADIFTVAANIAGIPAISIPSGTVELGGKNLPLGLQFMAAHGQEQLLFEIGKKFEKMKG